MIQIIQGKIQNQDTDIIVNSSNSDLMWENTTMNGDVHIKAGSEFTKSCQKFIEEYGSLEVGDIAVISDVGELNCKEVWNVFSPYWDMYDRYEPMFVDLIYDICEKFEMSEYHSISIPMIGCGAFMIPEKFVTKVIISVVKSVHKKSSKRYRILPYTEKQYKMIEDLL